MLKIHETTAISGELVPIFLRLHGGVLEIVADVGALALPTGAVDAVMKRFGAPLDSDAPVARIGRLDLGNGRALFHVRHLAKYDVIARDYLVYEGAGAEPLCALATTVAGALFHLARAGARAPSGRE